jgi:branched-chain amino acid transport system permease protein
LDTVVYASLFGLMAVGLTLTYLTTKVPNFAYGSFVTIGSYTSFSVFRINHVSPYFAVPLAFLLGALVSVGMYLGVLRTLARRGSSLVALMISTLAIDIAFVGIFGIYSDYIGSRYGIENTKNFFRLLADFSLFGLPGVFYVTPISLAMITIALFLFLTKTKFGIAMRASWPAGSQLPRDPFPLCGFKGGLPLAPGSSSKYLRQVSWGGWPVYTVLRLED